MPKRPDTKKIGLFMMIGFAFLIIVLLAAFGSRFISSDRLIVMHFNESIKGLNVGAPVLLNGVAIGKVSDITLTTDPENMDFSISVYASINAKNHILSSGYKDRQAFLDDMIAKGLRAKLANQSILTGQLMIELVIVPDSEAVFKSPEAGNRNVPEIPTILSPMGQLSQGLQDLHLKENMEKMTEILNKLTDEIVPETETLLTNLNGILSENKDAIAASIVNFNDALLSFKQGAKSFKNFADYIEQHPESILSGKGE